MEQRMGVGGGAGGVALLEERMRARQGKDSGPASPDMDEADRLLGMFEVGFLAATSSGQPTPQDLDTLGENLQHWLHIEVEGELLRGIFETLAGCLERDGFAARLAHAAGLVSAERDAAFAIASMVSAAAVCRYDGALGALLEVARAFGLSEVEARVRFMDILEQMETSHL